MKTPIPLIIDTDPGVDDFFCLAMAGAFPDQIDIKAVCATGGNNTTAVTTQNALNILTLLQVKAPVASGASHYLDAEFGEPVVQFHGRNGLGNIELEKSPDQALPMPSWDLMYRIAMEQENVQLLTVGPLTNVALALLKYPQLKTRIRRLTMMGGTTGRGNITPYAEANIGHDAVAARIVFESGIPIDMIGLNVTRQCEVKPEELDAMGMDSDPLIRQVMHDLIVFRNGEAMHDAVAAATLLDDRFIQWKTADADIETADPKTSGRVLLTPKEGGGSFRYADSVDLAAYKRIFAGMVKRYPRRETAA